MGTETRFIALSKRLRDGFSPDEVLCVDFEGFRVRVETNSAFLGETLRGYFGDLVAEEDVDEDVRLLAIQGQEPQLDVEYKDWPREAGKSGRKEEYADLDSGRVVRKVRTGVHFVVGSGKQIAYGPCEENANQIINFINTQVIRHYLGRGYQLCHASGICWGDSGCIVAATSGAGKSTLAMHLMDRGALFTSNDRILVKNQRGKVKMVGVPKWPRVNPGTLMHNEALAGVLPEERKNELSKLPRNELWDVEEKYDVMIPAVFGEHRVRFVAEASLLLLLNWDPMSDATTRIERVNLQERRDLLALLMKSAGPMVLSEDNSAVPQPEEANYLRELAGLEVFECTGGADFERAAQEVHSVMGASA